MDTSSRKTIVIVGGVAGGASCATRLRRMDESAQIIVLERGPYASFANCGLPYHIGGVIAEEDSLLVAKESLFTERFAIDLRTRHEVIAIDRDTNEVEIHDLTADRIYRQRYDSLVLAPGAAPLRPPLPGIDLPGIFTLRNIPDMRSIKQWISQRAAKTAVVVGGGFIGLEMAENLKHLGLAVTLVEMLPQVMPPMDPEMVAPVHDYLTSKGIRLALGSAVSGFSETAGGLEVFTHGGPTHPADLVILAIGVRPETSLAKAAGLSLGERGGIRVDEQMRTSDPHIFSVGDAVEVCDRVTGIWTLLALAGPANRQGRIAADAICGLPAAFHGTQGTARSAASSISPWRPLGQAKKPCNAPASPTMKKSISTPVTMPDTFPGRKEFTSSSFSARRTGGSSGRKPWEKPGWTNASTSSPWRSSNPPPSMILRKRNFAMPPSSARPRIS
jgi:NADPH-dependent 2,4-dienoyl-CoA reductase/sulfur reductase-like enzyme